MEAFMLDEFKEANYHFTLSAMMDLIEEYGYSNVLNDLDAMIEARIADLVVTEGVSQ
jgi:hypothetical protein